jgi:synaptobrevin family protein YKT6
VVICDHEYPVRPAFSLLTKVLDDFTAKIPQSSFDNPSSISFTEIEVYLAKYQDPRQADAIMKVQQELDETKIVLASPRRVRANLSPSDIYASFSTRQSSQF